MVRWYAIRGVGDCTGPFRAARDAGERWCDCQNWGGAQAVAMPVEWIAPFVRWGESHPMYGGYPDSRLAQWLRVCVQRPIKTSVPCLVEHGLAASLNSPKQANHRAIWYIGDERSGLEYAWK